MERNVFLDKVKCPKCDGILLYRACCEYLCDEWYECSNCKKKYCIDDLEERS